MPIKAGSTDITAIKFGSVDVIKVMRGTEQIWPETPYVNLFTYGGCESSFGWSAGSGAAVSLNTVEQYDGSGCLLHTNAGSVFRNTRSVFEVGKYYLLSGYIKNGNAASGCRLGYYPGAGGSIYSSYVTNGSWTRVGLIFQFSGTWSGTTWNVDHNASGANAGETSYVDAIMINEITAADYASGVAACLDKYAYISL